MPSSRGPRSSTQRLRCPYALHSLTVFFSVCFPFAGTGWASIGGGKGEAELLVTEGAACQVREATAKAAASVHCCSLLFSLTLLTFSSVRLCRQRRRDSLIGKRCSSGQCRGGVARGVSIPLCILFLAQCILRGLRGEKTISFLLSRPLDRQSLGIAVKTAATSHQEWATGWGRASVLCGFML